VEAYDLDEAISATLTNTSARGFVDTGQNVTIRGFISGDGIVRVIVRALGPVRPTGILPVDHIEEHWQAKRLPYNSSFASVCCRGKRFACRHDLRPLCPLPAWCEAIVLVASARNSSLMFTPFMSFARCLGIIFTSVAILFFISCERHHLGEYPEIQRDMTATLDKEASNTAPDAAATPTPVKFFPEKTSPSP
jgi:hypothetical protein